LNFVVAACARPMMTGDRASQAAVAFVDLRSARRLTDFMVFLPPERYSCRC